MNWSSMEPPNAGTMILRDGATEVDDWTFAGDLSEFRGSWTLAGTRAPSIVDGRLDITPAAGQFLAIDGGQLAPVSFPWTPF